MKVWFHKKAPYMQCQMSITQKLGILLYYILDSPVTLTLCMIASQQNVVIGDPETAVLRISGTNYIRGYILKNRL